MSILEQFKLESIDTAKEDARDIRNSFEVVTLRQKTYVFILAVHSDSDQNKTEKFCTDRGEPIGGHVYDDLDECYLMSCVDYLALGYIPISFEIRMHGVKYWSSFVPAPEAVLLRHMGDNQRRDVFVFKRLYNKPEFTFHYLQLIGE